MNNELPCTRFIISDLHLGTNDDFDIFKAPGKEEAFGRFLEFCAGQSGPIELVINGDFVDFLQVRPWAVHLDRSQAVIKAREIAAGNSRVFRALGKFLGDRKNRIVVLLGNHDVELAYDEVWVVIRDAITTAATIKGDLEFKNRVTQYNFKIGNVLIHVQHGNIRDRWNEIPYGRLFADAEKNTGFSYPPGTLLVYNIMNSFKERFQFVDLLKPEMPAVALLLARFEPIAVAEKFPAASLVYLSSLKNGFLGRVRRWVGGQQFGAPRVDLSPEQAVYEAMAQIYVEQPGTRSGKLSDLDVEHLEEFLAQSRLQTVPAAGASFGGPLAGVKTAFVNSVLRCLGRPVDVNDKAFYQRDHTGDDVDSAKGELAGNVKIVAFGHTHSALKTEIPGKGLYLNSGTWANLIALPKGAGAFESWLKSIADNTFERTSFPTYLRFAPAGNGVDASLNHWSSAGEDLLWKKNI